MASYERVTQKAEFVIAYDYGMGGLWGFMHARSPDEINAKYPELVVSELTPEWMTPERIARMREVESHDIDGEPSGMLRAVLAGRADRASRGGAGGHA